MGRDHKSRGCAYPLHVAIVIDAHHAATAHTHNQVDGLQRIEPDVHDSDLGLGGTKRRFDDRFKPHALLQQVLRAFVRGAERGGIGSAPDYEGDVPAAQLAGVDTGR